MGDPSMFIYSFVHPLFSVFKKFGGGNQLSDGRQSERNSPYTSRQLFYSTMDTFK